MSMTKHILAVAGALVLAIAPVVVTPAVRRHSAERLVQRSGADPADGLERLVPLPVRHRRGPILAQRRRAGQQGLAAKGYDTVTIDDCWMAGSRDADGNLVADPHEVPARHGLARPTTCTRKGLKFGIYEDAAPRPAAAIPARGGTEQQDADTFASWGVDYVKLDGCNVPSRPGRPRSRRTRRRTRRSATRCSRPDGTSSSPIRCRPTSRAAPTGTTRSSGGAHLQPLA